MTDTPAQVQDLGVRLGIIPAVPPQSSSNPRENSELKGDNEDDEGAWFDEDAPEWVRQMSLPLSPAKPIIDDDCNNFYTKHKGWFWIFKREKRADKWQALRTQLLITYLKRQHQTLKWTSAPSYIHDHPVCPCPQSYCREVDLVDIGRRTSRQMINFCKCIPDPVRLMHYSYFAGSPDTPSTAFSVAFVELYHKVWQETVCSQSGFLAGLMSFGNLRSKQYLKPRNRNYINRDLKRQFSTAVYTYQTIHQDQKRLYKRGLGLSSSELLSDQCARCFGPGEGKVKASPNKPDAIIALDSNFQHHHHSKASTDTPKDDEYPPLFISPSQLKPHERAVNDTASQAVGLNTACSESHTAADDVRNGASWDQCDDTGLFGSVCRHNIPLRFANINKTGKRLYYPIAILEDILKSFPDKRLGVLYDIGCHLDDHIKKRGFLPEYQMKLSFATLVFHAYAPHWPCQIKYHPRFIQFFGLSDGEGLECEWSFLSDLVATGRICTRLNRLLMISLRAEFYAEDLTANGGKWIFKKYHNAAQVYQLAKCELDVLFKIVNPATGQKYSAAFLEAQWESEREAQGSKSHHMDQLRLKLGNLLCLRDELKEVWKDNVSPEQALAQRQIAGSLNQRILEASHKVGHAGDTHFSNKNHQEVMLKLWSSKYELRMKFIALMEEKRPMQVSRSNGRASNLGVNRTSIVVTAVQKHALALKTTLATYLGQLANYQKVFPTDIVPDPAAMDYARLLKLKPESGFWNDGFITHAHKPWAVDPKTQHGMRQLAYYQRSKEEIRRIGWEIRRSMRWATQRHASLLHLFRELRGPLTEPISHQAQSLLESLPSRLSVTSILWHEPLMNVFYRTEGQVGDQDLLDVWKEQVVWISMMCENGELSLIPGDFECMPQEPPIHLPDLFEVENGQQHLQDFDDADSDATLKSEDAEDEDSRMLGALKEEDLMTALNVLTLNDIPEEPEVPNA
ncbi:hypothetical protein DFH28DRAFT_1086858 [Melampsora americana]|nr:hypothetical protein DFH28DRAFT_1086858 [Melampsora americana]